MRRTPKQTLNKSVREHLTFGLITNASQRCRSQWRHRVCFNYHESFDGIFKLFNAGVGKMLVLFLHLNVPVLIVSRNCASPGFNINAEYPMTFEKKPLHCKGLNGTDTFISFYTISASIIVIIFNQIHTNLWGWQCWCHLWRFETGQGFAGYGKYLPFSAQQVSYK